MQVANLQFCREVFLPTITAKSVLEFIKINFIHNKDLWHFGS